MPQSGSTHNVLHGTTVYGSPVLARSIDSLTMVSQAAPLPAVVPGTPPPWMLPASVAHFVDRTHVLRRLAELVSERRSDAPAAAGRAPLTVHLTGPGGVGKTALALCWAATLTGWLPDGQLYADLRGDTADTAADPDEVLDVFLRALGVHPGHVPAATDRKAELFRSLTYPRAMLVVLDNAHSYAQLAPLLSASPRTVTVVTSRRTIAALVTDHETVPVEVGPLDAASCLSLVSRIAGADRLAAEPEGADRLAAALAGLPLAARAAGGRLALSRELTVAGLVAELDDIAGGTPSRPEVSATVPEPDDVLAATLDAGYHGVSPAAARLYRLLGLHPGPEFTPDAAAAAAGCPVPEVAGPLRELVGASLLDRLDPSADPRYRMLDPVRAHAARCATAEEDVAGCAAAVRAHLTWLLTETAAADLVVSPLRWRLGPVFRELAGQPPRHADAGRAWAFLERERTTLARAVELAAEYGFDDLAWQLCEALWSLYFLRGHHHDWRRTHLVGAGAAHRVGDRAAEARVRNQLGFALVALGETADAEREYQRAADLAAAAGHTVGEASAVESLGLLRLRQDRPASALEVLTRARELAADVTDPRVGALLEHHLGRALAGLGRHAEALDQLARARCRLAELGDVYNEARALTSTAEVHLAAGAPELAVRPLTEAREVFTAERARVQLAVVAELLSLAARDLGDPAEEARWLAEALPIRAETGSPAAEAIRARLAELG